MINRVLLRIKLIQIVYAFYKGDANSIPVVEKELFHSIEKAYDLYFHLLQIMVELTHFAELRIDAKKNKLRPTVEDLNPNTRFIDNKFVKQLAENSRLNEYLDDKKISWTNDEDTIKMIYELIINSAPYTSYMTQKSVSYEDDKMLWRKIFRNIILPNEDFHEAIEDQSIYWTDDLEIVISFVLKTIKNFDHEKGAEQALLPMFRDDEDIDFAKRLIRETLTHEQEYRAMIDKHTQNWDLDRIAFMDIVIMQAALAEITSFPTIPVNVTLNEYIELSKSYSTERSPTFINGVLDNIVKDLKAENKLIKVVKI